MKEIAIPLYIPIKNNEVDYESLTNLINEINDFKLYYKVNTDTYLCAKCIDFFCGI